MAFNLFLILVAAVCNAVAQVSLKKGAELVAPINLNSVVANYYIWLGLLLYSLSLVLTMAIYRRTELSFVTPVSIGVILVLVSILSVLVFKETLSLNKMVGMAVVFAGIVILSYK